LYFTAGVARNCSVPAHLTQPEKRRTARLHTSKMRATASLAASLRS
jgi:hypothetical protein